MDELNYTNFNDSIKNGIVFVHFHADWCAPCRAMEPDLESVAMEFGHSVKFASVDVDQNRYLSEKNMIMNIPAILIFNNGKLIQRINGIQSRERLRSLLTNIINKHYHA